HADSVAAGTGQLLERGDHFDATGSKIGVSFVDVIDGKGDATNADVVERGVGLALRRRIDELDQVEHRCIGVAAEPHEDTSELSRLDAQRIADPGIIHGEVADLAKAQLSVKANRPLHVAHANVDVKEPLQHDDSPAS